MLPKANLLFALLTFVKVAYSAYTPCTSDCVDRASVDQLARMKLVLYDRSIDNYTEVPIGNASELMNKIDKSKETVVYAHGWLNFQDPGCAKEMINAYLSTGSYNFIRLDWDEISNSEYTFATRSTEGVGFNLAKALDELVASGLDPTKLSLVGHSLGGQICGYTGRYTSFKIERITGLDPAGPGFYVLESHLASGDAKFVVMIHTDRGVLGINIKKGDVDFYPNNGISPQPGCLTLDYCSHYRSCFYWAESVRNRSAFNGRKCNSSFAFDTGLCNSNEEIEMSPDTPTTAKGSYYLQTNSYSPYGRGKDGTKYRLPNFLTIIG